MPHQGIAVGGGRVISAAELAAMTTDVIDRSLIPPLPGADVPPTPRRGRHERATLARRIGRGVTLAAVLLWCGIAAICGVVFWASIP